MTRTYQQLGGNKPIPGNSTVTYTSSELPNDKLVELHVGMSGNGGNLQSTGLNRVRVKADGELVVDMAIDHMRSWINGVTRNRFNPQSSDNKLVIPLNDPLAGSEEAADLVGFPIGAQPTLELVYGSAGDGTGLVQVGWAQSDIPAQFSPRLLSAGMNVPASATEQVFSFAREGRFLGFGINRTGLNNVKLNVGNELILNRDVGMGLLQDVTLMRFGSTVADPLFVFQKARRPASQGTFVQLTTSGSWGGSNNELSTWAMVPQTRAA